MIVIKLIAISGLVVMMLGGCSAKIVILPKDAAYYYTQWQDTLKDAQACDKDLTDLKDSCDKLIPQIP